MSGNMKEERSPIRRERRQYYQHQNNRSIYQFVSLADDVARSAGEISHLRPIAAVDCVLLRCRSPVSRLHLTGTLRRVSSTNSPLLVFLVALASGRLSRQASRLPTSAHAHENAAEIPAPTSTTSTHQPKITAMQVPRFTRVRHEKAIPVSTIVQMVKTSTDVATE